MPNPELPPLDYSAAQASERPVTPVYRWPSPPYARFAESHVHSEAEPCTLQMGNGSLLQGMLTFFLPEQGCLQFQVPPSRTTLNMRFESFKRLNLHRVHQANPEPIHLESALIADQESQSFQLRFLDGELLIGETMGYAQEAFGLFLFLPNEAHDAVQYVFIPAKAYAEFSVGGPLGQYLIAENILQPEQVNAALKRQHTLRDRKIGEYLVAEKILTPDDLLSAIKKQDVAPVMRLGEALIELGLLSESQLKNALETQRSQRAKPLGKILVEMGFIDEQTLQMALARKMGFPLVEINNFPIEDDALKAVPYAVAARQKILPLVLRNGTLVVALEDPWRNDALEEVKFITQMRVVPVMAPAQSLARALREHYRSRFDPWQNPQNQTTGDEPPLLGELQFADINELADQLEAKPEDDTSDEQLKESDNALVRLVNTMIVDAFSQGASDIHIETNPDKQKVRIRFRKDGILTSYLELPASYRRALIARLKIMADLDISERRKPQDGKINFARFGPAKIELRVASIPTTTNLEDMVLRILASAKPVPIVNLGLNAYNLKHVQQIMERPYGLFLLCGPTGSGKTTTLHSCLSYINVPERKIWTAEDPVEITQPGLRQVQVNPKIGWTFANALRAFLRADPDVIMVGEMRDEETAKIGIESSLTGHLVLSTLHTNSAPESVTRLLDMGLDPFNFADALLGVLAQRLVRKLCPDCKTVRSANDEEIQELIDEYVYNMPELEHLQPKQLLEQWRKQYGDKDGRLPKYHCAGCETCSGTGYKGRLGIHELLVGTREVRRAIQTNANAEMLQHVAIKQGMLSLKQDGIEKILQGLTDLHEVRAASN